jgi:hypothetical protein
VTLHSGTRLEGAFGALDSTVLALTDRAGTPIALQRTEISRIAAPATTDGLANGALVGAGAGLSVALAILGALGSQDGYVLPSAKIGAPLLLSGVGGLVGILIDRAHEKPGRVLYLARPGGSAGRTGEGEKGRGLTREGEKERSPILKEKNSPL